MEENVASFLRRRLRRGSSLYNSPSMVENRTSHATLLYAAQLNKEKTEWLNFQEKLFLESKKPEDPIKCDRKLFDAQLKYFYDAAPDMIKFAADAKAFKAKAEFYAKMEKRNNEKAIYTENRIKENMEFKATQVLVDEIMEKIYFK